MSEAKKVIYMDNAATSWPKPPGVKEAMLFYLEEEGGNPGRSGHRLSIAASRRIFQTRCSLANLLGVNDPSRLVFTPNATAALSTALIGTLKPGDRVVTTGIEHNAVSRPLSYLKSNGVEVTIVPVSTQGYLDLSDLEEALKRKTELVVVNWASNVAGTVMPLDEISLLCKQNGAKLLVDGAQGAGHIPLNLVNEEWAGLTSSCVFAHVDILAMSGHKGLLGPQGTGALYLAPGVNPRPLTYGGTGSASASDEQPGFLPDKYESGTINGPGIAGLGFGIDLLLKEGIAAISRREAFLAAQLAQGLLEIPGIHVFGAWNDANRVAKWVEACGATALDSLEEPEPAPYDMPDTGKSTGERTGTLIREALAVGDLCEKIIPDAVPVISMLLDGWDAAELAFTLDRRYGIMVRAGLQCSPWAHKTLGTFPTGTVRLSPGVYTTLYEIEQVVSAISELAGERRKGVM